MDMEKILDKKGVEASGSNGGRVGEYLSSSKREYNSLHGKKVGVILQAKGVYTANYGLTQYLKRVNITLEATLESETENNIKLADVTAEGCRLPEIKLPEMYVRKDKLVAIYPLE